MAKVFINYQRSISAEFCRWLMGQLEHEFGSGKIFLDKTSLPLGREWSAISRRGAVSICRTTMCAASC